MGKTYKDSYKKSKDNYEYEEYKKLKKNVKNKIAKVRSIKQGDLPEFEGEDFVSSGDNYRKDEEVLSSVYYHK